MYNNPYYNAFNTQPSIERINGQIAELEKMKNQLQVGGNVGGYQTQPAINQTFQLAPNQQTGIRYVNSKDDVQKELVFSDTPFFNKEYTQLWVKNAKGEVKTYELREIVEKDQKDLVIDDLTAKIEVLQKELERNNAKSISDNAYEQVENTKLANVPDVRTSKKK